MSGKRKWDLGAGTALFIVLFMFLLGAIGYGISRYYEWQRELAQRQLQGELWFAAAGGDLPRVQALLRAGADPNALGTEGWSSLHGPVQLRKNQAVKALLDAGADPNAHGPTAAPPLVEAVSGTSYPGHSELVQMLLAAGADPNGRNPSRMTMIRGNRTITIQDQTALMRAVIEGHDDLVRLLLKHKADANLFDSDGKSALHWWVLFRQNDRRALALGPLLIRKGADPHLADKSGKTPLDYARELEDPRMRQTLERASAIHDKKAAAPSTGIRGAKAPGSGR